MQRLVTAAGPACLLVLIGAFFGAVLVGDRQFSHRDAGHFYYPLYQRVQQEWEAGRVPLWEPGENGGAPLLGNPTAAVFYPGKLLFVKPIPYAWGMRLYVVGHAVLCVLAMYAMARSWGVGRDGSTLAALAYGFGVPVLFQYCNVIFLVGAAWTPLGLRAVDRWVRLGKRWGVVELALVLAMQVLGGDPQSAYLIVLCAAGYVFLVGSAVRTAPEPNTVRTADPTYDPAASSNATARRFFFLAIACVVWVSVVLLAACWVPGLRKWSGDLVKPGTIPRPKTLWDSALLTFWPWVPEWGTVRLIAWGVVGGVLVFRWTRRAEDAPLRRNLVGLAAAGVLAGVLTAVQLLPAAEFTRLTARAAEDGPHDIYPFSLEPYRVVEWLWPNVFGDNYGQNRYWLSQLPPVERHKVWVPSLYLGGLTAVLAMAALARRGWSRREWWLAAVVGLSLLGSFGEFTGPVGWARMIPGASQWIGPPDPYDATAVRRDLFLRDGDGGFYWLAAAVLPVFNSFRFPSKLLTFTSLGLALLAGLGWDQVIAGAARRRASRFASIGLAVTIAVLGASLAFGGRFVSALRAGPNALSLFGPLDAVGALADARLALIHAAVILAAVLALLRLAASRPKAAGALAVILLSADLTFANARYVLTSPQADFDREPDILKRIRDAEAKDPAPGPFRVHRMLMWHPSAWYQKSGPDRHAEMVRWDRATLHPKYGLPYGVSYTFAEGTSELYDYQWFVAPFDRPFPKGIKVPPAVPGRPPPRLVYYPRRGFDLWGTRYFILPATHRNTVDRAYVSFTPETQRVAPTPKESGTPADKTIEAPWADDPDWQLLRNKAEYPRAWVVHRAQFVRPARGLGRGERAAVMEDILYQDDPFWKDASRAVQDPRTMAWVEAGADEEGAMLPFFPGDRPAPSETPKVTHYDPRKVEIEVELQSPGLVILADVFFPGWRLRVDGRPATILRVNRVMRGALLPPGPHRLVYTYEPESFRVGGIISLLGLGALFLSFVWAGRGRRRAVASAS